MTKKHKNIASSERETVLKIMSNVKYIQGKNGFWATIYYGKRKQRVSVDSSDYCDYIYSEYYKRYNDFPNERDIKDGLKKIRYDYKVNSPEDTVFQKRYGYKDDCIYIDMANNDLEYIVVSKDGYKVCKPEDDKALFINEGMQLPMVYPSKSESDKNWLEYLDPILNLSDDDKFLFKIYLVSSMNPNITTPIPYFYGKGGTGKSSMLKVLGDFIDPSKRGLVNWDGEKPGDTEIALDHSYFIGYDNISTITGKKSDLLCQTVTGGNASCRRIYEVATEINFDLKTRVALTSVKMCIRNEDLAQRIIYFNVPSLVLKERITEDTFPTLYEPYKSMILGDILEILSLGLQLLPQFKKKRRVYGRLASFELFGRVVASLLDPDGGEKRFVEIMRNQHLQQLFWDTPEDREYFEYLIKVVEMEAFDDKVRILFDLVNEFILSDLDNKRGTEIMMGYDRFSKKIHRYVDNIQSLGYSVEFYSSRPDNYSAVKIFKSDIL